MRPDLGSSMHKNMYSRYVLVFKLIVANMTLSEKQLNTSIVFCKSVTESYIDYVFGFKYTTWMFFESSNMFSTSIISVT